MSVGVEWGLLVEGQGKPEYIPQESSDHARDAKYAWDRDAPHLTATVVSRSVVYGDWVVASLD
jgi:hypothetical protein